MGKQIDYSNTSALDDALDPDEGIEYDDDGAEVVWVGRDRDGQQSSWLDDFEFDDYRSDESEDRVGSLWSRYGTASSDRAERIVAAQKLVQGFVDTFATGDKPYTVIFNESVGTAGTTFEDRKVIVSHKPLFDPTLTPDEANTILTAMGCHEASHVRYGRKTADAAKPLIKRDKRAGDLSNILDDNRIEQRFLADYPGYAGIFAPAIDYVAQSQLREHPEIAVGDKFDPTKIGQIGAAGAAIRYVDHVAWTPETAGERDWWRDWAARWSRTDRPIDHTRGIEEGLQHLDEQKAKQEQQAQEKGESQSRQGQGQGQGQQGGSSGQGQRISDPSGEPDYSPTSSEGTQEGQSEPQEAEAGERAMADLIREIIEQQAAQASAQQASGRAGEGGYRLPTCLDEAIDESADANGAEAKAGTSEEAQAIVNDARSLAQEPITGSRGEVYLSANGRVNRRARVAIQSSPAATASIRAAFARSRTGHFSTERGFRSGRLDNRSLPRVASDDLRLFAKRTAPSEGRYLVWLLVDTSGSMSGYAIQHAAEVATSLAAATRFMPNVTLDIWGWTDGGRHISGNASFAVTRVYHSGDPVAKISDLVRLPMRGTPDAETLAWAARAIRAATPRGVEPVIIIASDGQGSLSHYVGREIEWIGDLPPQQQAEYRAAYAGSDPEFIANLRAKFGVQIVSVAIGRAVDETFQRRAYGPKGYIPWQGSIAETARPLGDLVARIASGRA